MIQKNTLENFKATACPCLQRLLPPLRYRVGLWKCICPALPSQGIFDVEKEKKLKTKQIPPQRALPWGSGRRRPVCPALGSARPRLRPARPATSQPYSPGVNKPPGRDPDNGPWRGVNGLGLLR